MALRVPSRKQNILLAVVLTCSAVWLLSSYGFLKMWIEQQEQKSISENKERKDDKLILEINKSVIEKIKRLAYLVYKAKMHSRGSKTSDNLKHTMSLVNSILIKLNVSTDTIYKRHVKESEHVCPDKFMGGHFGWPQYHKGFETVNCSHGVHISKLLTIIKVFRFRGFDAINSISDANRFLSSLNEIFHNVTFFIATDTTENYDYLIQKYPKETILLSKDLTEGHAYNKLISKLSTPYALIARGIEFFTYDSRLQRLIREIESLNVVVAGGSFRYENGHWHNGCFQMVYRNFTLKFMEGYDESLHECLFCDYVLGPLVVKSSFVTENVFEDLDENSGLFEDWFLRVSHNGKESVVCPDSMFNTKPRHLSKLNWDSFFLKWNLYKLAAPEGKTLQRKCRQERNEGTPSQAMPLCTFKKMSTAIKVIMRACEEAGVVCELQEGTTLGAIKFEKVLPWDIDFDLRFVANNCSQCTKLVNKFKEKGISFGDFFTPCCAKQLKLGETNYVGISYKGIGGDITGHPFLDSTTLINKGMEPTKIYFDGEWVNVPRNPALTMRHRYGRETFQHAEHWRYTGGKNKDPRMSYVTNIFLPCKKPEGQDCLDRYNGDGVVQFDELLP